MADQQGMIPDIMEYSPPVTMMSGVVKRYFKRLAEEAKQPSIYSQVYPKQDLVPEKVRKAAGKANDVISKNLRSFNSALGIQQPFDMLVQDVEKYGPSVYNAAHPALKALVPYVDWPDPSQQAAVAEPPEVELTETTGDDGTKKTTTKVKMGGGVGGGGSKGAEAAGGLDRTAMYTALANSFRMPPRGQAQMGGIQVPTPPTMAAMNEQARMAYAPFLPREGSTEKPWQKLLGYMANAFTQTDQERQAYHNALDRNFQLNFEQNMQKETAKRLKMEAQLQEEVTLAQLQKYQQQQQASEQLANLFALYGPEIFSDPELNMGASTLMDRLGGSYGAIMMPRQRQTKMGPFDVFLASWMEKHPGQDPSGAVAAYKSLGRRPQASQREKDLRKMLFPTDPIAQLKGKQLAGKMAQQLLDPQYRASEEQRGVDIESLWNDLEMVYGGTK